MDTSDVFYRIRSDIKDYLPFESNEMFHVKFQDRNKVSTNRFSIPGFPALYMSKSLYTAWEEMRRPQLDKFCFSKIKCKDTVNLLDLRIWQSLKTKDEAKLYLILLPLIIACSFKPKDENARFKIEYIVPQMVVHSILKEIHNNNSKFYQGIVYNSTRYNSNIFPKRISLSENYIIPVGESKENGLDNFLTDHFEVSNSRIPEMYCGLLLFPTSKSCTSDFFSKNEQEIKFN